MFIIYLYYQMLTKDRISKDLCNSLSKYNPRTVILHGSVARSTNTELSDVDVLIIWNRKIPNNVIEIRYELERLFGTKVDMACMIYKNKIMDHKETDDNRAFLDNVRNDGSVIIGHLDDIFMSNGLRLI